MTTQIPQPQQQFYASPESTNQYQPVPPLPEPKPKAKRKWLVPVLVTVALLFGIGIGSATKPTPPTPAPITIEKPVEKRIEVTVASPACTKAFGYAEDVFSSSSRTLGSMQNILDAVKRLDASAITAENPKIDAETAIVKDAGPKYRSAKADCLAAVK